MKECKEIVFVLENCDFIKIPFSMIDYLCLDQIETTIVKHISSDGPELYEFQTANLVAVQIKKEADEIYYEFGMEDVPELQKTKFQRLSHWADITSIEIVFVDGEKREYYVNYEDRKGSSGAINENEDVVIGKSGDLYLIISKEKKKVKDWFQRLNDFEEEK